MDSTFEKRNHVNVHSYFILNHYAFLDVGTLDKWWAINVAMFHHKQLRENKNIVKLNKTASGKNLKIYHKMDSSCTRWHYLSLMTSDEGHKDWLCSVWMQHGMRQLCPWFVGWDGLVFVYLEECDNSYFLFSSEGWQEIECPCVLFGWNIIIEMR